MLVCEKIRVMLVKASPYVLAIGILTGRDISQGSFQAATLNIYSSEFFVINGDGYITQMRYTVGLYLNKLVWES